MVATNWLKTQITHQLETNRPEIYKYIYTAAQEILYLTDLVKKIYKTI